MIDDVNIASSDAPAGKHLSPQRMELREAAQAFEAIFLRQLLASARATDFGGQDIFSGQGLDQFTAMRDEHFADILSQNKGGLGLARSIEDQLAVHLSTAQTVSTPLASTRKE